MVTGGTGSIGSEIVSQLLNYNPKVIRIFSNSENELWEMQQKLKGSIEKLRFLLGDVRDYNRIERATQGIDYIFNAAAIKHVPISEYNPMEAINVNIHGLENIIEAAFKCNVKGLIHISTDKAVNPTTVMGATKMLGERLCISRAATKGKNITKISCVRFGNVLGSRGSIIPLIKKQIKEGYSVTLTSDKMKRFFLSIPEAVNLVLKTCSTTKGGEIFVLKMPIINIKDLMEVLIEEFSPKVGKKPSEINIKQIGLRPGEKLDETLISKIELENCYETDNLFIIYPSIDIGYELSTRTKIIGNKINLDSKINYTTKDQECLNKKQIKKILEENDLL